MQSIIKREVQKHLPLILPILIGLGIWFAPKPGALSVEGWHMLAIFTATIVAIIMKTFPMGAIAIIALAVTTATGTLSISQALASYSKWSIWLIVIAFFISKGFIKTQLGTRIAYYFVNFFGKSSLGLAYSFILSELLLSPAVPSITARSGGIVYPIVNALSRALGSKPNDKSARKIGAFLIHVCFQGSVITSAMFLTAMAANPIVADIALSYGVQLTWGTWAKAAIIPGIVSLVIMPLILYKIAAPELKHLPDAHQLAKDKLKEMGPMSLNEWIMLGVFIGLVLLWSLGEFLGINSLTTALIGVSVLLITRVLTFNELLEEKEAWGTFVWFGALLTLASYLETFGVIGVFSKHMSSMVSGLTWPVALIILSLIYFYTHYAFASCMAHVGAMYAAILSIAVMLGAPVFLTALILAFISSLYGGLTHYGIGSAPVLFGPGYVSVNEWWRVGFISSIVNILIWGIIGGLWWKFLGFW